MVDVKVLRKLCQNLSVLYVEDDDSIRDSMGMYLGKFFKTVGVAENGLEGLEQYEKGKFEIVISDLSMPKMNGIEMLQKIKKIDANQTVLITSAHSESEYMSEAIKIGIEGYIIKPFDFKQLNQELFKIVEKYRNTQRK